ncbi:hypothetical protein NDU88_003304 [Pleurodeles waltl]|uniref:Uncharacterized protein n=1 Tax=Pleurodeles waltl TaxID=8319 RepID=A0AAV7VH02_PLEWA|nr:hypothetical protein NDU88_003304 [Pleurodeles waltl]
MQDHSASAEGSSICGKHIVLSAWPGVEDLNALSKDVFVLVEDVSACAKEETNASIRVTEDNGLCVSSRAAKDERGGFVVLAVGSSGQIKEVESADKHDYSPACLREANEEENGCDIKTGFSVCLKNNDPRVCFVSKPDQKTYDGEVNPVLPYVGEKDLKAKQESHSDREADDQLDVYVTKEDGHPVSTDESSLATGSIVKEEEGASAKKNKASNALSTEDSNKDSVAARKKDESYIDFVQNVRGSSICIKKEISVVREIDADVSLRQQFPSEKCVRDQGNSVALTIQGPSATRCTPMTEEMNPSELLVEETGLTNFIKEKSGLSPVVNKKDNLRVCAKGEVDNAHFKHDNPTIYVMSDNGCRACAKEVKEGLNASLVEEKGPSSEGVNVGFSVCAMEDDGYRTCTCSLTITIQEPSLKGHLCKEEEIDSGTLLVKETSLRTSAMEEAILSPNEKGHLSPCHTKETILAEKHDSVRASVVKLVDSVPCLKGDANPFDPLKLKTCSNENPFVEAEPTAEVTMENTCLLTASHHISNSSTVNHLTVEQKVYISEEENSSLGRCCICNDEHSWPNNLLVYCDGGPGCKVAVHQGERARNKYFELLPFYVHLLLVTFL